MHFAYCAQAAFSGYIQLCVTWKDIFANSDYCVKAYQPAGIHWEVSEEKGYFYMGANKFFEHGSGVLHEYTPEMRAMNADFAAKYAVDEKANYLFILKYSGRTMSRDAAGFMPRGSQFGYIFTKNFSSDKEILQTVAHELGHGRLLLKHTFPDFDNATPATSLTSRELNICILSNKKMPNMRFSTPQNELRHPSVKVRGSQFGYIFTKNFGSDKEILQTVAHELGHGRLLLKHTFDKDYQLPQAGTDNLMDYTPLATHLTKWQWDLASDPGIAQGVFDRDEDGMMAAAIKDDDFVKMIFQKIRNANRNATIDPNNRENYMRLNLRELWKYTTNDVVSGSIEIEGQKIV